MDLPTYTNIWRIEKRLYKLYDFRLPMPLPLGQIAVFTAIAIPYVIVLTVLGLPFSHTSFWLYVLPPGVLAWLATRPVLESKRLPELIVSQLRYLGEPRTWCRLAPLAEKDEIMVVARVWRRDEPVPAELAARRKLGLASRRALASPSAAAAAPAGLAAPEPEPQTAVRVPEIPAWAVVAAHRSGTAPVRSAVIAPASAAPSGAAPARTAPAAVTPGPATPAREPAPWPARGRGPAQPRAVPTQERAPSHARHAAPPAAAVTSAASAWPAAALVTPPTGLHPAERPPAATTRPPAAPVAPAPPLAPALGALPPTASPLQPLPSVPAARMEPSAGPSPAPPVAAPPVAAPPVAASPAASPPPGPPLPGPAVTGPAAVAPRAPVAAAPAAPAHQPPMPVVPTPPAAPPPAAAPAASAPRPAEPPAAVPPAASPPSVTVTGDRPDGRPLRVVERALRGPADKRGDGWHDRVVVVPGGHRPGRPDFQQRDRARAQLPVAGSRRIVVLGCTVGAGQTTTTLMTGEVLASVRDEPVAVLDLNSGRGSLAERAGSMPAVAAGQAAAGPEHLHHSPAPSRLAVISSDATEAAGPPGDAGRDVAKIFEMISARYSLTLADPAASAVPRVLAIADQLILVAPASQDAARAIAMTLEWLEAHGYAGLAESSATVINGVSRQTMIHVEQAEAVARGRCRAIVRVPWDDQLRNPGRDRRPAADPVAPLARPGGRLLGPAAVQAYTALAGVLVAGLAAAPELRRAQL